MTRTAKRSARLDRETKAYVLEKQGMFMNLLEAAWMHQKIDEVSYKRLSLDEFEGETMDEAFDHFQMQYEDIICCCRNVLIQRIAKGEEFMESLQESDPRYRPGMEKLARLIEELGQYEM